MEIKFGINFLYKIYSNENLFHMGPSIKYVRKIFRKTNISNPLIRTRTCAYQGVKMLVFRKILGTYFTDDPYVIIFHAVKF